MRCCSHRWILRVVLVTGMALLLPSCGLLGKIFKRGQKDQEPEKVGPSKEERAPVRVVGEIASVHPEGFVLIRRHAQGFFGSGNLISSLSPEGNTASLRLTGETLGRYFAADIQEGRPATGDLVIVRRLAEGPNLHSTPVPEVPKPGFDAPWGKKGPPAGL